MPKAAAKFCPAGHQQWGKGPCTACKQIAQKAELDALLREHDALERQLIGPPPRELVIRDFSGRIVAMGRIPHGLHRRRARR